MLKTFSSLFFYSEIEITNFLVAQHSNFCLLKRTEGEESYEVCLTGI